jgi:hypothetical protein
LLQVFVMDKKELGAELQKLEAGQGQERASSGGGSSSSAGGSPGPLDALGRQVDQAGLQLAVASTLVGAVSSDAAGDSATQMLHTHAAVA